MSVAKRFGKIVDEFRGETNVTVPSEEPGTGRSFGSSGLRIKGKIFAMLSSDNNFVLKLPREKVDKLVAAGLGERFDPRHNGRVMQEWIMMKPGSSGDWLRLARDARDFVGNST